MKSLPDDRTQALNAGNDDAPEFRGVAA